MRPRKFFEERTDQSLIKARIVSKYFWAWAKVIMPTARRHGNRIGYIDLFAGPGRYKDGAASTPLLVLEEAIADPDMSQMLVTIFNDADVNKSKTLESEIDNLHDIKKLKHKPCVRNDEVGDNFVNYFESITLIPSLSFVDPWGYRGLSLKLVNSVIRSWGCDCIFFFNYNRINMGLSNELVSDHMNALFGEERANRLRGKINAMAPNEREAVILEELSQALKGMGGKFVLPFTFKDENGLRTSHHLIFVSKNVKGYEIMKQIMAKESSISEQGVASFTYCPADERMPLLFELSRPLEDLQTLLLGKFAGQTLAMIQIYERHHVDTRYIKKNYKDALTNLEAANEILVRPPANERPTRKGKITFADHVTVQFPKRR